MERAKEWSIASLWRRGIPTDPPEHVRGKVKGQCLSWRGATTFGYGAFGMPVGVGAKRRQRHRANRIAFSVAYDISIPDGMMVLHHCDNRLCINPRHMYLGTHKENMADKVARKRQASGERIGTSKLTREQVLEIRRIYEAGGATLKEIGLRFGVSLQQVFRIGERQCWKHVE